MIVEADEVASTPAYASITTLVPDWSVSSRVTAFTTTRLGGVSLAPYDSLNLGLHVNDVRSDVEENRRRLQDSFALPSSPRWLNQTHSSGVIKLSREDVCRQVEADDSDKVTSDTIRSADGAWTDTVDTVLAVLTADCLPVVISARDGTQVSVIHAGWRGLAAGILGNALAAFGPDVELHAWMGPAIGPSVFEVGEDVLEAFAERNPAHRSLFTPRPMKGKYLADIYGLARAELNASRSVTVTGGDYCTYSQANWFHSYRRDGVKTGRMATVVWISKA
ncbi:MAG: YfiH family protein [Porticoccaceae bacterium]|jgi:YfiH family protein